MYTTLIILMKATHWILLATRKMNKKWTSQKKKRTNWLNKHLNPPSRSENHDFQNEYCIQSRHSAIQSQVLSSNKTETSIYFSTIQCYKWKKRFCLLYHAMVRAKDHSRKRRKITTKKQDKYLLSFNFGYFFFIDFFFFLLFRDNKKSLPFRKYVTYVWRKKFLQKSLWFHHLFCVLRQKLIFFSLSSTIRWNLRARPWFALRS